MEPPRHLCAPNSGIESGSVVIQTATVSRLPFADNQFDLVTAIETHYYWPDLCSDLQEIWRVLKPGATLMLLGELYRRPQTGLADQLVMKPLGGTVLSPGEHRDLLLTAGYVDVRIDLQPAKHWISACGKKPR